MAVTYAVENIMSENLVTVDTRASLSDAMRLMVEKDIGSVIATRDGRMEGILTERDVLKKFCFDASCATAKVEEVMSSPLVTIDGRAAIGQAADLMAGKKIRRLLVTKDGAVRGIVTERDVMRATIYVFKTLADATV
ncbi:MAG: CBS domain-containing protein [Deltaproteobacteria bacterium]|nr:CBS domain-containing protein [Deltaproteobacteria bacterium]